MWSALLSADRDCRCTEVWLRKAGLVAKSRSAKLRILRSLGPRALGATGANAVAWRLAAYGRGHARLRTPSLDQGAESPIPIPVPVPDLSGDGDGGPPIPDLPGIGDHPLSPSPSPILANRGWTRVPVPDLPGIGDHPRPRPRFVKIGDKAVVPIVPQRGLVLASHNRPGVGQIRRCCTCTACRRYQSQRYSNGVHEHQLTT